MMNHFRFVDLFAGIGGFHIASTELGGHCVFACEIDENCRNSYRENFGIRPHGDIERISNDEVPFHDLLCAGFPCQPFSIMGEGRGFDDVRGTLFFHIARILKAKKPKAIILENVKRIASHDKGATKARIMNELRELGYKVHFKILNALDYGLPQKRERALFVGLLDHSADFNFPKPIERLSLGEVLFPDGEVDKKYYASRAIVNKRKERHQSPHKLSIWHENKAGNVSSYPYSCALRAGASYNYLLVNGLRRLTPRENLRLQGFPDSFKIVCSDQQTRKQTGNAIPVPMIREVIKKILYAVEKAEYGKTKIA